MKRIIEKTVQLRNPSFRFDKVLRTGTILQFALQQFSGLLRSGKILFRFRDPRRMILGKNVQFFNMPGIKWGRYVKLGDHVYLSGLGRQGILLGDNVGIGAFSRVIVSTSLNNTGRFIQIGNNVGIGEFAYLGGAGGLEIGDDCIIGQYFSCHPENHNCDDTDLPIRLQGISRKGIRIGKNCWIGSKVTILDGVTIGNGCVVAAGAVVTKSFPDNSIIAGVPAKIVRKRGGITVDELVKEHGEKIY